MKLFNKKALLALIFGMSFVANTFTMDLVVYLSINDTELFEILEEHDNEPTQKVHAGVKDKYLKAALGLTGVAGLAFAAYKNPEKATELFNYLKVNGYKFYNYMKPEILFSSLFLAFAAKERIYDSSKAVLKTIQTHKKKAAAASSIFAVYLGCEIYKRKFGVYPKQLKQLSYALFLCWTSINSSYRSLFFPGLGEKSSGDKMLEEASVSIEKTIDLGKNILEEINTREVGMENIKEGRMPYSSPSQIQSQVAPFPAERSASILEMEEANEIDLLERQASENQIAFEDAQPQVVAPQTSGTLDAFVSTASVNTDASTPEVVSAPKLMNCQRQKQNQFKKKTGMNLRVI